MKRSGAVMEVYKAIAEIIGEMSTQGIAKDSKNKQQGFNFRGIDAVYNALAPLLAKHKLMILPRVLGRTVTEKQTQRGGTLFYVVCECEFDFVSAVDGSKHTVKVFGEAMDSGDKATNKAMSIALKYAAFQTFFIPTEVTTQDPDAEVHHPTASKKPLQFSDELGGWVIGELSNGATHQQVIATLEADWLVSQEVKDKVLNIGV